MISRTKLLARLVDITLGLRTGKVVGVEIRHGKKYFVFAYNDTEDSPLIPKLREKLEELHPGLGTKAEFGIAGKNRAPFHGCNHEMVVDVENVVAAIRTVDNASYRVH